MSVQFVPILRYSGTKARHCNKGKGCNNHYRGLADYSLEKYANFKTKQVVTEAGGLLRSYTVLEIVVAFCWMTPWPGPGWNPCQVSGWLELDDNWPQLLREWDAVFCRNNTFKTSWRDWSWVRGWNALHHTVTKLQRYLNNNNLLWDIMFCFAGFYLVKCLLEPRNRHPLGL